MGKIRALIKIDSDDKNIDSIKRNLEKILVLNKEKSLLEFVEENKEYDIVILWHSQKKLLDLFTEQVSINKGDRTATNLDFSHVIKSENLVPIIHLSNVKLIPSEEGEREYIENRRNKIKWSRHVFRMDSSIWHYYISLEEYFKDSTILDNIVKEIIRNKFGYNNSCDSDSNNLIYNRYNLSVAGEYEDFYSRLSDSCYICNSSGGHSASVSPFLFHSERYMKSLLYNTVKGEEEELLSHGLCWRLLLVDDHPNVQNRMSSSLGTRLGKADIIRDNLNRAGLHIKNGQEIDEEPQNQCFIEIDYAKSVEEALTKIARRKYDIILLDYKLDVYNGKQEYGYQLLQKIKEDQEGIKKQKAKKILSPGPNGEFYFMFISAYTTAVQERLQAEGFYVSKDYWFIGRGACPTNTPYLFLYSLKRMMDIRYDKLTKHSKQLLKDLHKGCFDNNEEFVETNKGKYASMTMFLTKLFEKDNERNNCVNGFNAFLNLRHVYDNIKNDIVRENQRINYSKSSLLIVSMFKDEEFGSNSFWEHLQNLVYLTAFGTIRQWPEMWEDYTFIKGKLENAEDLYRTELTGNEKPSILIRNYILSLKGMMS